MAAAVLLLVITYGIYVATSTTQIESINYEKSLVSSIQSQHSCEFHSAKASSSINCASYCSQRGVCRYYVFDKTAGNHQCLMCQGYILGTNQLPVRFQQIERAYVKTLQCRQTLMYTSTKAKRSYWKYSKSSWPVVWEIDASHDSVTSYSITLEFKSALPDGILFYSTHPDTQNVYVKYDFVAGLIRNGHIKHSFNNLVDKVVATSPKKYNDNAWHAARFVKDGGTSHLCIDNQCSSNNGNDGGDKAHLAPEMFVGGVPNTTLEQRAIFEMGISDSFVGCIRNIRVDGAAIGFPNEHSSTGPNEDCLC